jgi:hypothetical protein
LIFDGKLPLFFLKNNWSFFWVLHEIGDASNRSGKSRIPRESCYPMILMLIASIMHVVIAFFVIVVNSCYYRKLLSFVVGFLRLWLKLAAWIVIFYFLCEWVLSVSSVI